MDHMAQQILGGAHHFGARSPFGAHHFGWGSTHGPHGSANFGWGSPFVMRVSKQVMVETNIMSLIGSFMFYRLDLIPLCGFIPC